MRKFSSSLKQTPPVFLLASASCGSGTDADETESTCIGLDSELHSLDSDGSGNLVLHNNDYDSMDGYDTGIDTYGGHSHGTLGYHYHAHMSEKTSLQGNDYTLHTLMRGAWKGQINDIPEFWQEQGAPAYSLSQHSRYVGKQ